MVEGGREKGEEGGEKMEKVKGREREREMTGDSTRLVASK